MPFQHIAILKGGLSSERDVSLVTGAAVANTIEELGYKVTEVDVGRDIAQALTRLKPDAVFNALHGTYGEDGCVQGVLEFLRIPYTHSGVLASALAMNKPAAKMLFASAGIACAEGRTLHRAELKKGDPMPRPYVIKPVSNGSSVGVYIVMKGDDTLAREPFAESEYYLVETYIPGQELSVAVLDGRPLGAIEIRPKQGFYNYRNKYTAGMTEYLMPAEVSAKIYDAALEMARKAHDVLGCRGVTRSDIRYDAKSGRMVMLEVNTHPGMTPTSLVPKIARHAGIEFPALIETLLRGARCDNLPA